MATRPCSPGPMRSPRIPTNSPRSMQALISKARADRAGVHLDHAQPPSRVQALEERGDLRHVSREHQHVHLDLLPLRQGPQHVEAPEVRPEQDRPAPLPREPEQVLAADVPDLDPVRLAGPDAEAVEDADRELAEVEQALQQPRLALERPATLGPGVQPAQVLERRAPRLPRRAARSTPRSASRARR